MSIEWQKCQFVRIGWWRVETENGRGTADGNENGNARRIEEEKKKISVPLCDATYTVVITQHKTFFATANFQDPVNRLV